MSALLIRAEVDEGQAPRFCGAVLLPFAVGDNRDVVVKTVDDRKIESLKIVSLED